MVASPERSDDDAEGPFTQAFTPRVANGDAAVDVHTADAVDKAKPKTTSSGSDDDGSSVKTATKPAEETPLAFSELYRYATPVDKLCLVVAAVCAGANGALYPCMALAFGNAITSFQRTDGGVDTSAINSAALDYAYMAVGLFVTDYIAYVLFSVTAERQMKTLRNEALRHMLYMEIGWYDANNALQLSSHLTGDTVKIKDGMGNKLGESVKYTCQFFAGYIIGFLKGWDMALVMCCVVPIMVLSLVSFTKILRSRVERSQKLYAEAGAIAEETLGSIRTIASLNGEKRAIDKYNAKTLIAETENIQLGKYSGAVFGVFIGSVWIMYAAGLWYGGSRVASANATPGDVFQAFFGVLLGTISLAQISPNINAVVMAHGAAAAIYKILDTPSAIDASKDEGLQPNTCNGKIQAIDLHFSYPTRPEAPILQGYSVDIEAGQTVAFVGASGGGKSTLIALLERYYNPQRGQILLDGRDISTLNIAWLRAQIGMVSQEPVLFARTIYENIAAGGDNITREQAIEAAKMANAHNFIMTLPQQYDTLVGEKGALLSGGQKQRVAIARAIVRNPKILVLDEATSALDAESERIVQDALNDLMGKTKMTTLVIAHRLSTVRRADKIVVLADGRVVEEGKHNELLAIEDGVYSKLYTIQEEKAKGEADAVAADLGAAATNTRGTSMQRRMSHESTKSVQDHATEAQEEAARPEFTILDAMRFSRPELKFFGVGMMAACVSGVAQPASAILISELVNSMTVKYAQYEQNGDRTYLDSLSDDVTIYGISYLAGAVVVFLVTALQQYSFAYMAQKLTSRLRWINFTALCRQNIAFFDEKKNAAGALTADLSTNATKVSLISGDVLGRVVQAGFTFAAALAISFGLGSWLLTIIMLAVFPLLVISHIIRGKQYQGQVSVSDELAEVGAHASEALGNMRTVVALGLEKSLSRKFEELLELPFAQGRREAQVSGLGIAFSSFITFATYSLIFWYGGVLVNKGSITFLEMMRTLMALMMSAQGVSAAATFFSETTKATKAGAAIVALRDRVLPIDAFDEGGLRPSTVEGRIEFQSITFCYPTRPEVTVLKNYSLTVEAGQTVAFCGPSGGGKSTCIAMIQRFYDPVEGHVSLDGRNIKDLNIQWLRGQIGLVGQEPTLFLGTIAENIAFGLETKPSHDEIEAAARMANAHDFITQFPDSYETQVGNKGEQLSGGQKQRIAIARAILKNPNILLLDEATSALDAESETIVQEALDNVVALQRRTTIIVAHRLSTIRTADKICVVSGGKIAETGTHAELLALGGIYKRLVESTTS